MMSHDHGGPAGCLQRHEQRSIWQMYHYCPALGVLRPRDQHSNEIAESAEKIAEELRWLVDHLGEVTLSAYYRSGVLAGLGRFSNCL